MKLKEIQNALPTITSLVCSICYKEKLFKKLIIIYNYYIVLTCVLLLLYMCINLLRKLISTVDDIIHECTELLKRNLW